jgi:hypothetical protein
MSSLYYSLGLVLMMPLLASSFVPCHLPSQPPPQQPTTVLYDSENPWEGSYVYPWEGSVNDENLVKFQDEETLLQIHCKPMHNTNLRKVAIPRVREYVQEFLFHNALPVQSLRTIPTEDGGLELIFWKGDQAEADGGMRFFIVPGGEGVQIVVKRESEGQTTPKTSTEKLVVQAFLKAFTGKDRDMLYAEQDPPTYDVVTMESVFHKWMFYP